MPGELRSSNASQSGRLSNRFEKALILAYQLHKDQKRKDTDIPYIAHLLAVASLVLEAGGGEDEAIAALLHDAAEDQGGKKTLDIIRDEFGEHVAQIVEGCSDSFGFPKPPWNKRKEAYLDHLLQADPGTRLVSLADKLHNCRDILLTYRMIGDSIWDRFKGKKEGTMWYYRELDHIFTQTGTDSLTLEFHRVFTELTSLVDMEGDSND